MLSDLSEQCLALARAKADEAGVALAGVLRANALDLTQMDAASFDAVLLLGPLYHLGAAEERGKAVREALRILRAGGLLFAAFITRFAFLRDAAINGPERLITRREYFERLLTTGTHDAPAPHGFTFAHFAHPAEVTPFMESHGLKTRALIGCEGVVAGMEDAINRLDGEAWSAWVDLNYRLGQEPTLWGASDHLLYVDVDGNGSIDGFLIGELQAAPPVYDPGGLTCWVDDFVMADPTLWPSAGRQLLERLIGEARLKGAVQVAV